MARDVVRIDERAGDHVERFGLSEGEVNWVRSAKAGNDEDGYSEKLLGLDEEGWFHGFLDHHETGRGNLEAGLALFVLGTVVVGYYWANDWSGE